MSENSKKGIELFSFASKMKRILVNASNIMMRYSNLEAFYMMSSYEQWNVGERNEPLPISDAEATEFLKKAVSILCEEENTSVNYVRYDFELGKPWTIRRFMQVFGTDIVVNQIDKSIWIKLTINEIIDGAVYEFPCDTIITDCRQKHEEDALRALGAKFIFVNKDTENDDSHITEQGLIPKSGDIVIDNNGTLEQLNNQIKEIFK
ncbi:dNMP kinase [Pectobacterium phage POP12]|nr:dNMP kinase [Pectobacterium phage POP12]